MGCSSSTTNFERRLYFGYVSLDEIRETVKDAEWQKLRKEMKGRALAEKYDMPLRYSERLTFGYLKGAYAQIMGLAAA